MNSSSKASWDELLTAAHAWYCNPADFAISTAPDWIPWLSAAQRQHYDRLKPELRHGYLVTRALCRLTLSRYTGVAPQDWTFTATGNGKPAIATPSEFSSLQFNLTHTNGFHACIVTRAGEVGIDAEEISRPVDIASVASHFFSNDEQAMLAPLQGADRTNRFFEIWVLKEACLKTRGLGLTDSLNQFTIRFKLGNPLPLEDCILGLHRPTPNVIAATALRAPQPPHGWTVRWERFDGIS